jgi:hypothetical protein
MWGRIAGTTGAGRRSPEIKIGRKGLVLAANEPIHLANWVMPSQLARSFPYKGRISHKENNSAVERLSARRVPGRKHPMFTAKHFRAKAAESAKSLTQTADPGEIHDLRRSIESLNALAENEDWLANNFNKIIEAQGAGAEKDAAGKPVARATVAEIEERILRCLGAAVIMQWNTIPTKLQRELFDTAGSMGDVLNSAALRAQIARFLHQHKDDDDASPADRGFKPNAAEATPVK